jgi:hypothetical protein
VRHDVAPRNSTASKAHHSTITAVRRFFGAGRVMSVFGRIQCDFEIVVAWKSIVIAVGYGQYLRRGDATHSLRGIGSKGTHARIFNYLIQI